jgi:hypothetical protein
LSFFEWYERFKEGQEHVKETKELEVRKLTGQVNMWKKVLKLVHSDRRLSVRMMAEDLNLDKETVRKILTELNIWE